MSVDQATRLREMARRVKEKKSAELLYSAGRHAKIYAVTSGKGGVGKTNFSVNLAITLAKKGTLSARRRAIALLGNRDIVTDEDGTLVKKNTVIGKLFSELGPRYLDRPGGYTRIIPVSLRRLGDNGQLVLLQLIGKDENTEKEHKTAATKGSRKKTKKTAKTSNEADAVSQQ